jgi:RHS repeat-associated protein
LPTANLLTGGVDERFTRASSTETDDYLTDALGSTVALTGATGASQVAYSYSPFGSQSATGGTTTNSYTFTGRETDGLGIDYYRARYYNPTTGRFISEDPSGLGGGINLYAYAGGSPTNFTDPSGLKPHDPNCGSVLGCDGKGRRSGRKIHTDFFGGNRRLPDRCAGQHGIGYGAVRRTMHQIIRLHLMGSWCRMAL